VDQGVAGLAHYSVGQANKRWSVAIVDAGVVPGRALRLRLGSAGFQCTVAGSGGVDSRARAAIPELAQMAAENASGRPACGVIGFHPHHLAVHSARRR
jgi:hypothetical protein